jgi:PIN domain nuclease of toxin-antitoxin system
VRVFDASALLAFLRGESGGSVVHEYLREAGCFSAANWAEVAQKLPQLGISWAQGRGALLSFDLTVEPVTIDDAEAAAALWSKGSGLSLADRLCLALGNRLGADIITCDTAWAGQPGVELVR